MFVQSTTLVGVLAVLDVLLLRRLRASVRYAVWTLVLVKLVLPVSLSSSLSLAQWMPAFDTPVVEQTAPPFAGVRLSSVARDDDLKELSSDAVRAHALAAPFHAEAPTGETATTAATTAPSIAPIVRSHKNPPAATTGPTIERVHWNAWALASWLGVVAVLLGVLVRRVLHVRRIVKQSGPPPDRLQAVLDECLDAARLRRAFVRLRMTRDLGSPAICGFFRATVLIPQSLAGSLDRPQLRQVFTHELIHWKRFDLQVNSLQTVLQVLYFYQPVVWVANAVLRRLREQAVDEAVLVMLQAPVDEYSTTLLNIASYPRRPAELALNLTGVVESRKALAGRIRRMLTRPLPKTARLGVVGLTTTILLGLALLSMAADDPPPVSGTPGLITASETETRAPTVESTSEQPATLSPKAAQGRQSARGSAHVRTLSFSPDGRTLAGGSVDGWIRLWPLHGPFHKPTHTFQGHDSEVYAIHFSRDGRRLYSVGQSVKEWNSSTGELISTTKLMAPVGDRIDRVFAFSADGRLVAGCNRSNPTSLHLWDAASGEVVKSIPLVGRPLDAGFSADGRLLAAGTRSDGALQIIDVRLGESKRVIEVHPNSISAVAFSPNSEIVGGGDHRGVSLWNVETGELQQRLEGHSGVIESLAFSDDGERLISGGQGPTIQFPNEMILLSEAKIWNLTTGQLISSSVGEMGRMEDVAFSPDGRFLARCDYVSVVWEELEGGRRSTQYFTRIRTIGQRIDD
jgi:WD40 repeat protein/beta-lactamase regulating signal transducer with metallopeptidase domain